MAPPPPWPRARCALPAKRTPLPPGCIVDKEGRPTTDAEDFYAGGAIMPLGGDVAGHKGYGLAMASALISGLAMIDDPDHTLIGASSVIDTGDTRGQVAGVFVTVINPAFFGDAAHYQALVAENITAAKRIPAAPGFREVLVPGEPEVRSRAARSEAGIAIPAVTWEDLLRAAERFGVAVPEHRAE
ncbi:MAG: Ldh family oxidoreductase [Chloroflexota bacterium]